MVLMPRDHLSSILEKDGEREVRKKLAEGGFIDSEKPLVKEWLEQQTALRTSEESRKTARFAKSSRNAAWVAAIASLISMAILIWQTFHR